MESKLTAELSQCQHLRLKKLIRAAAHVSQARLLILQERRDTVGANRARSLEKIADVLSTIVSPLERMGRSISPDSSSAHDFSAAFAPPPSGASKENLPVPGGVQ